MGETALHCSFSLVFSKKQFDFDVTLNGFSPKTPDNQNQEPRRCYDCGSWCGRCIKGHINRIAIDGACANFENIKNKTASVTNQ